MMCSQEAHEELKADDQRWLSETTHIGTQLVNETQVLELRQCNHCTSTLSRRIL